MKKLEEMQPLAPYLNMMGYELSFRGRKLALRSGKNCYAEDTLQKGDTRKIFHLDPVAGSIELSGSSKCCMLKAFALDHHLQILKQPNSVIMSLVNKEGKFYLVLGEASLVVEEKLHTGKEVCVSSNLGIDRKANTPYFEIEISEEKQVRRLEIRDWGEDLISLVGTVTEDGKEPKTCGTPCIGRKENLEDWILDVSFPDVGESLLRKILSAFETVLPGITEHLQSTSSYFARVYPKERWAKETQEDYLPLVLDEILDDMGIAQKRDYAKRLQLYHPWAVEQDKM